jgi:hypothetical protein
MLRRRTMVSAASLSWIDQENTTAAKAKTAAVKKAKWYAARSGELDPAPPDPRAEPTPMSTVDKTATPVALPT